MKNKNAPRGALLLVLALPLLSEAAILGTGSRIPRSDLSSSVTPITVIDAEEFSSQNVDIEDLLSNLPTTFSSGAGNDTATATVNLRGMDTGRSLILINGRRPIGTQTGVNLDSIPTALVDRIEVLSDGSASSLYGADAVAGVVNVVTRDEYDGFSIDGSWVLNDVQEGIRNHWFSVESKEQCDATSGATLPAWGLFNQWQFGLPQVENSGDTFYWNGNTEERPKLDLSYVWKGKDSSFALEGRYKEPAYDVDLSLGGMFTMAELDGLVERIKATTDIAENDRRDYIATLGFAYFGFAFAGGSDQAMAFGHFDPEEEYQKFREWSAARTDADREAFNSFFGEVGLSELPPMRPGAATPSGDTTAESADGSPGGTAPPPPDPFDRYPYPPDYAFDFSHCTDEQKSNILDLIRERDQARADHSYYIDYVRRSNQSATDAAADDAAAQDALDTRDAANTKLHIAWLQCVDPAAAAALAASSGLAVDDSTAAQSAAPDNDTSPVRRFATPQYGSLKIEAHFYSDDGDGDGAGEPVPDIGFSRFGHNYGLEFGLPFSAGALRDTELDAGAGSQRAFTDSNGVARIGDWDTDDEPDFGIRARLSFPLTDNWQIGVDYDRDDRRNGPTLGLRIPYTKYDSVYQEFLTDSMSAPEEDSMDASIDLGSVVVRDYFSIGQKSFKSFFYPESGGLDSAWMDGMTGQTYWTNNECGDSALPPEGAGYLTADESPVKTIGDQWAFRHANLKGDEPSLDEFAKPVVVAVIDTGLDWNHADLVWDNLWRNEDEIPGNNLDDDRNGYIDDVIGWSFTDESNRPWDNDGHGTAVAGIIAATQGNGIGIDGVNGSAKIMVLKALNNFGRTRATFVARAILYAADNGAQIINLSVSPGFPKVVQDAVDYAAQKGILVVAAAGNNAEDIGALDPGPLRNVLTVGAIGPDDKRTAFSNVGRAIDVVAPGVDVVSLRARATDFLYASAATRYTPGDAILGDDRRYYRATGTSFSTPIATGIGSLVLANNPGLDAVELKRVIVQSARDIEAPGVDRLSGYGAVDAAAALAADPAYYVTADIAGARLVRDAAGQEIEVLITTGADQYAGATLEIGSGAEPSSWTGVGIDVPGAVTRTPVARIPLDQLAGSETWTLRLTVRHADGSSRQARYQLLVPGQT